MTVLKLRDEKRGDHVHTTFFCGPDNQTLRNLGTLVMDVGEYQLIGAALLLGAEATHGHLRVVSTGWSPAHDGSAQ